MKVDVLIIGHGIAGCVLSHLLNSAGKSFVVLDEPQKNESSRVAAGLYNPITGRKMVKTWQADLLFPLLRSVYRSMEQEVGLRFLYETPIYRPFIDIAEQNDWQGRSAEAGWAPYLKKVHTQPLYPQSLHNPQGGLEVGSSGWVDVPAMLNAWSNYLKRRGQFKVDTVEEEGLEITPGGLRYGSIDAKWVVFANGRNAAKSKYWSWLPFRPVKGEILKIASSASFNLIPNRGVFVAPSREAKNKYGRHIYRVGSTYSHQALTTEPTAEARHEIEGKLKELLLAPYRVVGQLAGIRPATKDRRPLVGGHPDIKTFYLLNGLGTKGVSLAPYCASALFDHLYYQSEIPAEINISRYFSLY